MKKLLIILLCLSLLYSCGDKKKDKESLNKEILRKWNFVYEREDLVDIKKEQEEVIFEDSEVDITQQLEELPPPPPQPAEVIEIVEDDVEIEEEK